MGKLCGGNQWHLHAPPQHPPPELEADDAPENDLLPFAGAAKTENCTVFLVLEHFGHVIACFLLITTRS